MWHVWISSLGVTAAIILAGGYVLLQVLRERHHFQLMQAAMERGITDFGTSPIPSWFVSMRPAEELRSEHCWMWPHINKYFSFRVILKL